MRFRQNIRLFFFALVIVIIFSADLASQSSGLFSAGLGINLTHLRDRNMSPLIYSGRGLFASFSLEQSSKTKTSVFRLQHERTSIRSEPGNQADYLGFAFKNYTFYGTDHEEERYLAFGWANQNALGSFTHQSYSNYGSRYYYFTAFGPALRYRAGFELWDRQFRAGLDADLQLLGFFLRPSYISSSMEGYLDPENSGLRGFIESIQLFFPGRAWNFGIAPSFTYTFMSGNSLTLEYRWGYVRINRPGTVAESKGNWLIRLNTIL